MAINKVDYDGRVLMDLTEDTVTENNLLEGATAHGRDGEPIEGKVVIALVIDSLDSESTLDALSANQGRVLDEKITEQGTQLGQQLSENYRELEDEILEKSNGIYDVMPDCKELTDAAIDSVFQTVFGGEDETD